MNKNKLTSIIHKTSKEYNVSFNVLLQTYFFERFLSRLAMSDYREHLILKGGFLLSSLLRIKERSTIDMDFTVSDLVFNKATMEKTIREITQIDMGDNVLYQIKGITEIMEQSKYTGYQISLIGKLENIKVPFSIDLATGDPITRSKATYQYQPIVYGDTIQIQRYTVETVLAEKLQTVMDKKTGNSRMKDFYDIYILMKLHKNLFDTRILNEAIEITFSYRKTSIDKTGFLELLHILEEDREFVLRWNNFVNKNDYVEKVGFKKVKNEIVELINLYG